MHCFATLTPDSRHAIYFFTLLRAIFADIYASHAAAELRRLRAAIISPFCLPLMFSPAALFRYAMFSPAAMMLFAPVRFFALPLPAPRR